ncbi:MAG: histidine phosphatase family protein [Paracoccaceae bacterium]
MINTSKLILIRHAPVEKSKGFIPKKNPNAVLNKRNIKSLASYIPNNCNWYVSPLKRTVQTAEELSKFVNVKSMIIDNNLVEQNFGDWAGKKISEVWEELKHYKNQHNFSFICPEICPPNGDSFSDQCKRAALFIDTLKFYDQKSIVVIAHSGTIRAILSYVLGLEPDVSIGIEILHLSITLIEVLKIEDCKNRGGRFRLLGVNQQTF